MAAEELGEGGEIGRERGAAPGGDADPGPRAAAGVALLHLHQAGLLQHGEVLGQVAGSQAERLAQVAELGALRFVGDREDPEPVPLVHGLVQAVGRMLRARLPRPPRARLLRLVGLLRRQVFRRAHGLTRWGRCTANAPAPVARSTSAGSSTFGRDVRLRSLPEGFQPSRNSTFSMLYRLASSAVAV